MKNEIWILGIYISDRMKEVNRMQSVLTKFGCSIRTRLGLHSGLDSDSFHSGLILLELTGDPAECLKLERELSKIDGLEVKKMIFTQA